MDFGASLVQFSMQRPKLITALMIVTTLCLALLAGLPSFWPKALPFLNPLTVDTDPENMLPEDEFVRVFHDEMKREMNLYDMVVLGIVNESHPDGVFNTDSLQKIYELTEYAKTLQWTSKEDPNTQIGIVARDIIAPSTVDNIEQGGLGIVKFEWLMPAPPKSRQESIAIREKLLRLPFMKGTMLSEDGKALCLYLPLTSKDLSYTVSSELQKKIASFKGEERYFITGLPVAEDTFGVEMFKQMAISAPVAMLIIFGLMMFFFRKFIVVISPLIVAMVAVLSTMGLLIATGNTVHIMSSMIPIFIMPIAVLDAIHIGSEFFDRYQETKNRQETIRSVMDDLFMPLLYTSLTTSAGFASLALTPIPPVQIFGIFVAFGVMVAWFWTVAFIPSYLMLIRKETLETFGLVRKNGDTVSHSPLSSFLNWLGKLTYNHAKIILVATIILVVVAAYGISRITINDNPTKWFAKSHPIRIADKVLNEHFGGTYMAYLSLEAKGDIVSPEEYALSLSKWMEQRLKGYQDTIQGIRPVLEELQKETLRLGKTAPSKEALLQRLTTFAESGMDKSRFEYLEAWDEALLSLDQERQRDQIFKQPKILSYIEKIQTHLLSTGTVGKSNSLADIVKTVHRELLLGNPNQYKIPNSSSAVAQCLITYQNSHRPQDLWHFVTPDFKKTVLWVQLKSGDNTDMSKVIKAIDTYIAANPSPIPLVHNWFGLTYINVTWQNKMVSGMLKAFLGSFVVVLLLMTILFRSSSWGLLSMVPLTITIGLIYGAIGLIGKDYDMPVAILSSLSLGLAIDYAIHFLSRSRKLYERYGSWAESSAPVFKEPARAITRNAIVVGLGFLPLLLAPLVPYRTVGIFIAAILFAAGVASLMILPSLITLLEDWLFPKTQLCSFMCNCTTCIVTAVTTILLIAVNIQQFFSVGWTSITWISIIAIILLTGACGLFSMSKRCRV
ncbi:MAG: MMPL family transporter [Thermodesulfobacteriota bacterium]|nr:MMPL family transporter [Thermodesulfobacteriota bacterium]